MAAVLVAILAAACGGSGTSTTSSASSTGSTSATAATTSAANSAGASGHPDYEAAVQKAVALAALPVVRTMRAVVPKGASGRLIPPTKCTQAPGSENYSCRARFVFTPKTGHSQQEFLVPIAVACYQPRVCIATGVGPPARVSGGA